MELPECNGYDLCRLYISDYKYLLGEEVVKRITGWCRARDLPRLSSCSQLIDSVQHSADTFRVLLQVEAFFKKNASYSDPKVCDEAALLSFMKNESRCRTVNRRLDFYYVYRDRLDPDVNLKMSRMEHYISKVLGTFEPFLGNLDRLISVTAGATARGSRRNSRPFMKIHKRQDCTPKARPYIEALAKSFGLEKCVRARSMLWNRVEFVPKTFKTSRTIACEPGGNIPFQLAFDRYAKARLYRFGINLRCQSHNQNLAKRGSIDGSLSTIDISSASDSVALNTVAWLFPHDWFEYLSNFRSPYGRLPDGTLLRYSKFSSMGNGSTFAIETLIFAAACYACGSKAFSVYGDDIIVETELYRDVVKLLSFLGFRVNLDKSFAEGPFRESCGGNFYSGVDVTPFYLREHPKGKPFKCHLVNGLLSVGVPYGALWEWCKKYIELNRLPIIPFSDSTTAGVHIDVHSAYERRLIRTNRRSSNWIPMVRAFVACSRADDDFSVRSLLLWALRKHTSSQEVSTEIYRPTITSKGASASSLKYKRKWVHWNPPVVGAPCALFMRAGFLFSGKPENNIAC